MDFIDGITVLNETMTHVRDFGWTGWGIFWLSAASIMLLTSVVFCISEKSLEPLILNLFTCVLLFFFTIASTVDSENGYEYQVLIDEKVNMVEFSERYDLIKQEGKTYIIRVKK